MRWGIVATIKAPARDILNFAAHYLEIGADHLYIYLDDDNESAQSRLEQHPRVSVIRTDKAYWTKDGKHRPAKHQVRQGRNATHAYARASQHLDWLLHVDVDEFLWPHRPVGDLLAALPDTVQTARVRPIEALAPPDNAAPTDVTFFKGFIPAQGQRQQISQSLFPTFGLYIKGGFLSHIQGKIFVRTGLLDVTIRIHNAFQNGEELPQKTELSDIDLCHVHVKDWETWLDQYRYRHNRGSYRSDLRAAVPSHKGGMTIHDLFATLEKSDGKAGLRAFYDEVCVASPDLLKALEKRDLLRAYRLELDTKRQRQFP
ncbi:MAG: glycosyltransferase family 2 protein [Shimia thalassica]|uniref:glycosyltransferase family 2 protein n=1 Tax=Shimia thalassica TaxID=1715693 RepID=UPI003299C335